ncbi:Zinc carboxypeptidase [Popillia japonica]|uniref:Zinc carboxypeptidase A 1 n=1 Tax=Popillia japonica TaxID=7064 RepID=A0AAW1HVU0_POPJA
MKVTALILAILSVAVAAEKVSYEGYKVYELLPANEDQLTLIRSLNKNQSIDFWSEPRMLGKATTVMVPPNLQKDFVSTLESASITYSVLIENVERVNKAEQTRQATRATPTGRISFTEYQRYGAIQDYLSELAANYPDIVSVEEIGTSYEGRSISMIKIGAGSSDNPTILVDGGIHAREWISPAFVTYIIQELVENEANRNMIENTNWLIIPVLNPDGYEYTHTSARLWRKTRSYGTICFGVDGNRNFDYHWMETGASAYQCDETYAGDAAFSESETAALRDLVLAYGDQIKLYLTFHQHLANLKQLLCETFYGNYLLYPWGYTSELPEDADVLDALAVDVEAAIASVAGTRYTIGAVDVEAAIASVAGTRYTIGSSTNVLYAAAGGSDDWVKGVGGVALSYTIELPGGGIWGFDLPAARILPVSLETFEGVKVYQSYVENNFRKN